jgi:hypothetical protein
VKKSFLYGFHGRQDWGANRAMLVGAILIFLYIRLGESQVSIATSKGVPTELKLLGLAVLPAVAINRSWRINRRFADPTSPRMSPAWLVVEILVLFAFAMIAADPPAIFYCGSLLWTFSSLGVSYYYRRKSEGGHAAHDRVLWRSPWVFFALSALFLAAACLESLNEGRIYGLRVLVPGALAVALCVCGVARLRKFNLPKQ